MVTEPEGYEIVPKNKHPFAPADVARVYQDENISINITPEMIPQAPWTTSSDNAIGVYLDPSIADMTRRQGITLSTASTNAPLTRYLPSLEDIHQTLRYCYGRQLTPARICLRPETMRALRDGIIEFGLLGNETLFGLPLVSSNEDCIAIMDGHPSVLILSYPQQMKGGSV